MTMTGRSCWIRVTGPLEPDTLRRMHALPWSDFCLAAPEVAAVGSRLPQHPHRGEGAIVTAVLGSRRSARYSRPQACTCLPARPRPRSGTSGAIRAMPCMRSWGPTIWSSRSPGRRRGRARPSPLGGTVRELRSGRSDLRTVDQQRTRRPVAVARHAEEAPLDCGLNGRPSETTSTLSG